MSNTLVNEPLLTAQEVAERLRVKPYAVWEWAREGGMPHRRLGTRRMRFYWSEVAKWMDVQGRTENDSTPDQSAGKQG